MNIQLWPKFSENYRPFRPESGIFIGHSGLLFRSESAIFNSYWPMVDGRRQSETLFPNKLKEAKITPIYKKGDKLETCNNRPIPILPTLSKNI